VGVTTVRMGSRNGEGGGGWRHHRCVVIGGEVVVVPVEAERVVTVGVTAVHVVIEVERRWWCQLKRRG